MASRPAHAGDVSCQRRRAALLERPRQHGAQRHEKHEHEHEHEYEHERPADARPAEGESALGGMRLRLARLRDGRRFLPA